MKNTLKIEYTQIIIIILSIIVLFLLPIKYKFYWSLIYPLIFLKINKYVFPLVLIMSLILMPSFLFFKIPDLDEPMKPNTQEIKKFMNNNNIQLFINENDNLIYARNKCYHFYNDCEYQYISNQLYLLTNNRANYVYVEGNISHINYDKRTKYKFNKYLTEKDWRNKTIFIPDSIDEVIIYNYSFFKDEALKKIKDKPNKCELLLYGSQNSWEKYKEELVKELKNDVNNLCIDNIERNNINYRNLTKEEKNKDKIKLIEFLKR